MLAKALWHAPDLLPVSWGTRSVTARTTGVALLAAQERKRHSARSIAQEDGYDKLALTSVDMWGRALHVDGDLLWLDIHSLPRRGAVVFPGGAVAEDAILRQLPALVVLPHPIIFTVDVWGHVISPAVSPFWAKVI